MLCIIHLLNDPLSHLVGLENISFRRLPPPSSPQSLTKLQYITSSKAITQDHWPVNDTDNPHITSNLSAHLHRLQLTVLSVPHALPDVLHLVPHRVPLLRPPLPQTRVRGHSVLNSLKKEKCTEKG